MRPNRTRKLVQTQSRKNRPPRRSCGKSSKEIHGMIVPEIQSIHMVLICSYIVFLDLHWLDRVGSIDFVKSDKDMDSLRRVD